MPDVRMIRVLVHQGGPIDRSLSTAVLERVSAELEREPADLVVLSELALSPYFAASRASAVGSSVPVSGPEVRAAAALAGRYGVHLVLPFAEAAGRGVTFNSVALLGPDGLVPGRLVSGPRAGIATPTYRKVHLSENASATPGVHEKYHFTPGDGFVVWDTAFGHVAPLICYDRSFPESWRAVAAAGAEIAVVPMATSRPERVRMLESELTVAAVQNGIFVVAACKGGSETLDGGHVAYSGGSMVVGPSGTVIDRADAGIGDVFLRAMLDPRALEEYAGTFHYARDRRPNAYLYPAPQEATTGTEEPDA